MANRQRFQPHANWHCGRQKRNHSRSLALLCALAAVLFYPASSYSTETAAALKPFLASYVVNYRGLQAGTSTLELRSEGEGKFNYSSRSNARGLFRLVVGHEISQVSVLEIASTIVRPLRYTGDDGSTATDRDISLDFNWQTGRVSGVDEDSPVDLPLQIGVQDVMSAQVALMWDALRGETPKPYFLADKTELKSYTTLFQGNERLMTALGELDTVVYVSRRMGAKHSLRVWLAPSLGYIPVQAEQLRETRRVWIMRIASTDIRQ
ncbi:MAG: DUF3108 domain-containing protein [Pseudomonadota bacterium]